MALLEYSFFEGQQRPWEGRLSEIQYQMVQFCWRDEFAAFQISVVRTWEQMWEDFLFHMGTYFIMWAPVSSPVSLSHTHTHTHVFPSVASGKEHTCQCSRCKEMQIRSLGWEDTLGERVATHSNILAWRIPWTEEPGGPQPMGSQRVGHD